MYVCLYLRGVGIEAPALRVHWREVRVCLSVTIRIHSALNYRV